jgi:hypothetical protein
VDDAPSPVSISTHSTTLTRTEGSTSPSPAAEEGQGGWYTRRREAASSLVAELLVYSMAHQPLLAALQVLYARDHERLQSGASCVLSEGLSNLSLPGGAAAALHAASEQIGRGWAAIGSSRLPSQNMLALTGTCDAIASLLAPRELSAEELMPLVSYSLAQAVASGRVVGLFHHLALVESFVASRSARTKHGYCLTTVQVAARYICNQEPRAPLCSSANLIATEHEL